jgi:hypothetical protein
MSRTVYQMLVLAGFFSISVAGAATTKSMRHIDVEVQFGEKVSVFQITDGHLNGKLDYASNQGVKLSRSLTPQDVASLFKQLKGIASETLPEQCARSRVQVVIDEGKKTTMLGGCLFGKNQSSRQLADFVNLLASLAS